MAESQNNLCVIIPSELHSRVRAAREQAGVTLSVCITKLLTNYYKGGNEKKVSQKEASGGAGLD